MIRSLFRSTQTRESRVTLLIVGFFVVGFMGRSWCHVIGERKLSRRRWGKNWSHASVARYDASKWWNRNYNFGYNFVHIWARTMLLVASERSHWGASKWYKIYPEKCRLSPKFIVYPKIYRLSQKICRLSPNHLPWHKTTFISSFSFILRILRICNNKWCGFLPGQAAWRAYKANWRDEVADLIGASYIHQGHFF